MYLVNLKESLLFTYDQELCFYLSQARWVSTQKRKARISIDEGDWKPMIGGEILR